MARAALDILDPHIGGTRPHGDAVVAGPHGRSGDRDEARHLDMDTVGVGAVARCCDGCTLQCDATASEDGHVEELAVDQLYATQQEVLRLPNS